MDGVVAYRLLRLDPPEPHRGLTARETPRRHDQDAIIIGRADVAAAIACDRCAGVRDHLEAFIRCEEAEILALDGDAVGHLDDALGLARPRTPRCGIGFAE